MQTVGNILWLIFVGIWLAIGFVLAGIVMFILLITIPFGIQAFKLAGFALWPFGRHIEYTDRVASPLRIIGNILWIVLFGWHLFLAHIAAGVALCLTIIGIPFGIAAFKLSVLALVPFGAEVMHDRRMAAAA